MKQLLTNTTGLVSCFRKDEDGATALTFALGLIVMLMAIGTGMDFASASKMHVKSQSLADASALAAAVYIKNNDNQQPTSSEDGFLHNTEYTAGELGYKFNANVIGQEDGVKIKVNYFEDHAIASVYGKTRPSFMAMFGHEELNFSASSRVEYYKENAGDPATVMLVLDNSGSMAWDDAPIADGGSEKSRIVSLQDSVKGFMDTLAELDEDKDDDERRVIRTAMIPFTGSCGGPGLQCSGVRSDGIIQEHIGGRRFGVQSDAKIERLRARAGTNPSGAMERVEDWMKREDEEHEDEIKEKEPHLYDEDEFKVLKYVIFMTDGANSPNDTTCRTEAHPSSKLPFNHRHFDMSYNGGGDNWRSDHGGHLQASYNRGWSFHGPSTYSQGHSYREVFSTVDYICESKPSDWDTPTLETCKKLKQDKVEIFTIAYGLKPGTYEQNYRTQYGTRSVISEADSKRAEDVLQACATSSAHFIRAENAETLNKAFEGIGESIVADLIRVSN